MKKIITTLASLVLSVVLVGACAASAATPEATPVPSVVPTVAPEVAVATPDPTPQPSVTPAMPTDMKAPAFATISGLVELTKDVTRTQEGECQHVTGGIVDGTFTASDARLSGSLRFEISGVGCGPVGFEYGTQRIENAGGTWEGFCSGGIWNNESASNLSCWFTGSGGYAGLTAYTNGTSAGFDVTSVGVILPMPAPKQP